MSRRLDRRRFLGLGAAALAAFGTAAGAQQPMPGSGESGRLYDPRAAGRPRDPVGESQNDPGIIAIEKQLKCTCGCNLDVYICRTTDFTCTYSPALHKEIVALKESGLTADEVIEAYLEKYGPEFRMAPKAEGFNLAGYLVPGIAVLAAGTMLALVLRRRAAVAAAEGAGRAPGAGTIGAPGRTGLGPLAMPSDATPEEAERLRRSLEEVEQ
ncbi:MAG TPA: cytochrome c-type biogenesis protein CcmH [Gemmatimonadales bacterium]|nr:cytochrome c-type biogenesis protein CcmH [Gemmatimonadales bacterium]